MTTRSCFLIPAVALAVGLPGGAVAQLDVSLEYASDAATEGFLPVAAANMDLDQQQELVLVGPEVVSAEGLVQNRLLIIDGLTAEVQWRGTGVLGGGAAGPFCDINNDQAMELMLRHDENGVSKVWIIGLDYEAIGTVAKPGKSDAKTEPLPTDDTVLDASQDIVIHLQHDGPVKLIIYNMQGEPVRKLLDTYETEGKKTLQWDGRDDAGNSLPAGKYFYRLDTFEDSPIRQTLILR